MLGAALLLLLVAPPLALLAALALNHVQCRRALAKLRRQLPNTPFMQPADLGWFGNHTGAVSLHQNVARIHERHLQLGDTFAYLYNQQATISTCDLDLIKQVCVEQANENVNRQQLALSTKEFEQDCIVFARDEQWRRIRRPFAGALKPARFRCAEVEQQLERSCGLLIGAIDKQLDKAPSKRFHLDDLMRRFSLNVVMSCIYKQYNLIHFELDKPSAWVQMVARGFGELATNPLVALGFLVPSVSKLCHLISFYLMPMGRWRRDVLHFVERRALEGLEARRQLSALRRQGVEVDPNRFKLSDGTEFRRSILDHIIDQFHLGKLSAREYRHSSAFLLAAADVTVADSLVFTLMQLAANQRVQRQLRASLQQHGEQSQYLTWVLNESLRLMPPVPAGSSRISKRPVKLANGDWLPAGGYVQPAIYTIHRDPRFWGHQALEFRPERWANAQHFHACQFMPFGAGLRSCPGKEFALHEMRLLLANLIQRFQLDCEPGAEKDFAFDSPFLIFLHFKQPFFITLTRLDSAATEPEAAAPAAAVSTAEPGDQKATFNSATSPRAQHSLSKRSPLT